MIKAIALAPKDPVFPAQLGHVYLEKKDYPNAVNELIVAINMNPSSNDVLGDLVTARYSKQELRCGPERAGIVFHNAKHCRWEARFPSRHLLR